jgi:hypothetical protein
MTLWDGLGLLVGAGVVVAVIYGQIKLNKLPVRFAGSDEFDTVKGVLWWAEKQIGAHDPRRKRVSLMIVLLNRDFFPIRMRISTQDLEVLAPFIDRYIAGEGPPWSLPAEYEDRRPQTLRDFKARMKAEGLWPDDARGAGTSAS